MRFYSLDSILWQKFCLPLLTVNLLRCSNTNPRWLVFHVRKPKTCYSCRWLPKYQNWTLCHLLLNVSFVCKSTYFYSLDNTKNLKGMHVSFWSACDCKNKIHHVLPCASILVSLIPSKNPCVSFPVIQEQLVGGTAMPHCLEQLVRSLQGLWLFCDGLTHWSADQ